MSDKVSKRRIALEVAIILAVLFGAIFLILLAARVLDYQLSPDPVRRIIRISQITLFAFFMGLCFFICTTALGLNNYHNGGQFSRLYVPILFFSATLLAWLTIQAINSFDVLYHHGMPEWTIARGPEVTITSLCLQICFVVIAPGLFLIRALQSVGWSRLAVASLMIGIFIGTGVLVNLATRLGG